LLYGSCSHFIYNSYELIAAAVAYEAVNLWEKKQKEEGKEVQHATAKKLIAGIAAKEVYSISIHNNNNNKLVY
jgi:abortive infection bacteriophage resistance protein